MLDYTWLENILRCLKISGVIDAFFYHILFEISNSNTLFSQDDINEITEMFTSLKNKFP